jgi:hypothetical protein
MTKTDETRSCPDCGAPMQFGRLRGNTSVSWQKLPRGAGRLRAAFGRIRPVDAGGCRKCGRTGLTREGTEEGDGARGVA